MTGETPSAVVALVGVTALRLSLTGAYLNFVKPSLRPWLIVAGGLLVLLGGWGLWRELRGRRTADHAPAVAWLLVLPVLAVFLVAPSSLGAFAASRNPARFTPRATFPALRAEVAGAVPMSLGEYTLRALYDEGRALDGRQVRLTGFVARERGAVYVTRFVLSCCAADARSIRVELPARPALPADDTWIEAVGRWQPVPDLGADDAGGGRPVGLDLAGFTVVPKPARPYE